MSVNKISDSNSPSHTSRLFYYKEHVLSSNLIAKDKLYERTIIKQIYFPRFFPTWHESFYIRSMYQDRIVKEILFIILAIGFTSQMDSMSQIHSRSKVFGIFLQSRHQFLFRVECSGSKIKKRGMINTKFIPSVHRRTF